MPGPAKTPEQIVDYLLDNAIPVGDCWECHLRPSKDQYKERHYVQVGGRSGIKWRVTRLIWTVTEGPIPEGQFVLHECDNPRCINLDHLFLGTAKENSEDMVRKGRQSNQTIAIWKSRGLA